MFRVLIRGRVPVQNTQTGIAMLMWLVAADCSGWLVSAYCPPQGMVSMALAGAANAASVAIGSTAAKPVRSHFLCRVRAEARPA